MISAQLACIHVSSSPAACCSSFEREGRLGSTIFYGSQDRIPPSEKLAPEWSLMIYICKFDRGLEREELSGLE